MNPLKPWTSMNRNTWISFIVIALLCLFLIFGMPGLNPSWFQFPRNYEINNNSHNWANYEYGYNLMMSAEPNSIFMTEGGDNQVFSLLYFATAERMRPDIDFFDQKGNVFPRLYGDLLNTHPDEIDLIRNIRDFQLFSTGRPIYLTWERPGLEKLNINTLRQQKNNILNKLPPNQKAYFNSKYRLDTLNQLKTTARNMVSDSVYDLSLRSGGNLAEQDFRYLGPWYFKNFGMVFRVTPLRYAIVDALEALNGRGDFTTIHPLVASLSKIPMIPDQFDYYVNQLQSEGYVKREENEVVMVRPFRGSFDQLDPIELWDHYRFSYLEVPHAGNWDFLTREIFANSVRMLTISVERKMNSLNRQLSLVENPASRDRITQEMNRWNQKLDDLRKTIPRYNYDNPGMTYPYAVELNNRQNYEEAVQLYALTAQANYRFSDNYLRSIDILLKQAEEDSENRTRYLTQARNYLQKFYRSQEIMNTMTGRPPTEENNNINIARSLEKRIDGIANIPAERVERLEQEAGNDIQKLNELANLYRERGNHEKSIDTMKKILNLEPQQYRHYQTLFDYAKENRIDIALDTVNQAIQDYPNLQGDKPPVWELQYIRGNILFRIANVVLSQDPQKRDQFQTLLNQSRQNMHDFLNGYNSVKDTADNTLKQKANAAEKTLERIEELLKKQ